MYGIVLLWATWVHEYMAFLSKLTGIACWDVLKEQEVCDFDKLGQHVNEMMADAVKKIKNF